MSAELAVVIPCFNERANVVPLVQRLAVALAGVRWEAIFVDDDSPDGTAAEVRILAATDDRIRCLRRVGRRGLSSAVIEGVLSSSAAYVAVIDGDLQHDETRLPEMLRAVLSGECDIVVGSRYVEGGDSAGLRGAWRHRLSEAGIGLAQRLLPVRLSDPMSGFFMVPRAVFERAAGRLTGKGFKILLDLLLAEPGLRVREIPFRFRDRVAGESKLDALVLAQFAGVLIDKLLRGLVPLRFLAFAAVGAVGVLVNVAVTAVARRAGLSFGAAEVLGTMVAMAVNFQLNNQITYRYQRLRGPGLWRGLAVFMLVCGLGAVANIGIATALYAGRGSGLLAAGAGAVIGVVWNYAVSATLVWRV